jgi:hypothetical protein
MSALTGDISFPPQFYGSNDYRLIPASKLRDRGTIVHVGTTPFTYIGKPDIGAWEMGRALSGQGGGQMAWGRTRFVWGREMR